MSGAGDECLTLLHDGLLVGLTLKCVAAFLSFSADVFAFSLIFRDFHRNRISRPNRNWKLFNSPLDAYILSLFTADLLQGMGSLMNVKWVHQERLYCSTYCTAQGTIEVLGEAASAMATLAIAVHVFLNIVFLLEMKNMLIPSIVISFIWLYVTLYAGIAAGIHRRGADTFDQPNTFWCWIGSRFTAEEFTAEYIWLWITAAGSILLYIPLFIIIRRDMGDRGTIPYKILLYPLSYSILVLPISVARWIDLLSHNHHKVPNGALFACSAIFQLTGFVNVVLWLKFRGSIWVMSPPSQGEDASDSGMVESQRPNRIAVIDSEREKNSRTPSDVGARGVVYEDEAGLPP